MEYKTLNCNSSSSAFLHSLLDRFHQVIRIMEQMYKGHGIARGWLTTVGLHKEVLLKRNILEYHKNRHTCVLFRAENNICYFGYYFCVCVMIIDTMRLSTYDN